MKCLYLGVHNWGIVLKLSFLILHFIVSEFVSENLKPLFCCKNDFISCFIWHKSLAVKLKPAEKLFLRLIYIKFFINAETTVIDLLATAVLQLVQLTTQVVSSSNTFRQTRSSKYFLDDVFWCLCGQWCT